LTSRCGPLISRTTCALAISWPIFGFGRFGPSAIPQTSATRLSAACRDRRRKTREADLSTQQIGAQAPTRIPRPHGDQRRPQGHCCAAGARTQAAQRLSPAAPVAHPISWNDSSNGRIFWPLRVGLNRRLPDLCCKCAIAARPDRQELVLPYRGKSVPRSSAIASADGCERR
jgi:hypothetical protein